jgi:ribosomal protein S18 acetylase RimI-like enzyme
MPTTTTIRIARPADYDHLLPLVVAFRDHFGERDPSDTEIAASVARLLGDPDTEFVVAQSDAGDFCGYIQTRYRHSVWLSGFESQLEDVFVTRSSRRSGVGLRLLEAAVVQAEKRGCRFVGLNTNERNADALRLYARAGFSGARERWQGGRQLWLTRATAGATTGEAKLER